MAALYNNVKWKTFRDSIIESDGGKCSVCGRGGSGIILQVHHKKYVKGQLPWQYAHEDCITLCKGCHAAEHGKIMPKFGWEYCGDEDLGDLIGTCENCGSAIRYVFTISHENWGVLEVGTYCCDNLTDSTHASNLIESKKRFESRKARFINSNRWEMISADAIKIRQGIFDVEIYGNELGFNLKIYDLLSSKIYDNLHEAKSKAFEVIENGELIKYLKDNNKPLPNTKKNKG